MMTLLMKEKLMVTCQIQIKREKIQVVVHLMVSLLMHKMMVETLMEKMMEEALVKKVTVEKVTVKILLIVIRWLKEVMEVHPWVIILIVLRWIEEMMEVYPWVIILLKELIVPI